MWPFNKKRSSKKKNTRRHHRGYAAASADRLVNSWTKQNLSADAEIYQALPKLRARSRDLAINNDYGRRFMHLLQANVVGHKGIQLQSRIKTTRGDLNTTANKEIEQAWKQWGKKGVCTADGGLSWVDTQKLIIASTAREGELLIRLLPGWNGNKYRFAIQMIEADHLDETLNKDLTNGHKIRMGVEKNQWGRPLAYWVLKSHPYDHFYGQGYHHGKHERVPASEIIHPFITDRIGQTRGVPWMATPARRAWMLDGYEEAELVAARTAASKMGFFKSPDGDDYTADEYEDDPDSDDPPIMDAEAGSFANIGPFEFEKWDPDHPVAAFESFIAGVLRGVASGLNVSYVSLANDLRGVSYSSIRQGELADRDHWRLLQIWMIENAIERIFTEWMKMQTLSGAIKLPSMDMNIINRPLWKPRGWEWVDPLKEITANEKAVKNFIKTLQDVVADYGGDIFDNIEAQLQIRKALDKEALYVPAIHEFELVTMKKASGGGKKNANNGSD